MINSNIEWTDHTTNLWWGCQKVSPGCDHCYADRLDHRYAADGPGHWGPHSTRKEVKSWEASLRKIQRVAQKTGRMQRVFCMSMGDIFEKPTPVEGKDYTTADIRARLWKIMPELPGITWLFLTKRPGNISKYVPAEWATACPPNVWFGCSIVNQEEADREIRKLLAAPGTGNKFVSMEPLLGAVDLTDIPIGGGHGHHEFSPIITTNALDRPEAYPPLPSISWVIVGGESGPGARPMHPDWVRSLRDQCGAVGVPFFFKQWGEWCSSPINEHAPYKPNQVMWADKNGIDVNPIGQGHRPGMLLFRSGKKASGRMLDGREHNDFPAEMTAEIAKNL